MSVQESNDWEETEDHVWSRKDASPSVQVLLKSATNKMSEDVTPDMVGKTEDSEDVEDC